MRWRGGGRLVPSDWPWPGLGWGLAYHVVAEGPLRENQSLTLDSVLDSSECVAVKVLLGTAFCFTIGGGCTSEIAFHLGRNSQIVKRSMAVRVRLQDGLPLLSSCSPIAFGCRGIAFSEIARRNS